MIYFNKSLGYTISHFSLIECIEKNTKNARSIHKKYFKKKKDDISSIVNIFNDLLINGKTYTKEELQEVFDKDLNKAIGLARQLMEEFDVRDLPTTAQHTITEMVFQLGKSGVSKFRNMWKCLQESNFIGASYEMLDSKWNKQTPNRCKKLADQMKSCE